MAEGAWIVHTWSENVGVFATEAEAKIHSYNLVHDPKQGYEKAYVVFVPFGMTLYQAEKLAMGSADSQETGSE